MANYNFKEFFSERTIHNSEYVSNAHFLIKKSELKKSQLDFINLYPMNEQLINSMSDTLKKESRKSIITEFIPDRIVRDIDYNVLVMKNYAIQEGYYNFFQSLKYKVCIVNETSTGTMAIYNYDNEFVGIVLPIRLNHINLNNSLSYAAYLEELRVEQEAEEQRKQNLKKCLYIKNNKAVIRNKELTCVADIVNDQAYENIYITNTKDAEVYLDLGIVYMYTKGINRDYSPDDFKYYLNRLTGITLEIVLENIQERKDNNQFVNVADIKLIELSGAREQEVQELIDYRQAWYNRKAQEDQEKRIQREQEDREYVEEKNKEVEELVMTAEQAILNKKEVKNKDITVYKSRYESKSLSLILYIMKQNNINVSLKTQGWINKALADIHFDQEDEGYTYSYYTSSANSTVFDKYLVQLIKAVQNKHLAGVTAR